MDDPVHLAGRTKLLLSQFNQHAFKAEELRSAVPLRPYYQSQLGASGGGGQHTENLTRFTQHGGEATGNMTGMTGVSDSELIMDPEDKERALEDLQSFKDFVSTLKFAYLENNIKLEFVSHILDKNGPRVVTMEETNALEQQRLQTKAELKARKLRAAELEGLIRKEAEKLETRYEKTTSEAALAAELLRECEAMDLELQLLKSNRTQNQRITIDEAQLLCEEQGEKLATFGPEMKATERKMKETTSLIRARKSAIEKLTVVTRELEKERLAREREGKRDERAEEECRWYTNATALYSSLLGIRRASINPNKSNEILIEYDSLKGQEGDTRTLSIKMDPNGKMKSASLVDSSDSIADIVQAYLPNQDIPSFIQEVRARIGR